MWYMYHMVQKIQGTARSAASPDAVFAVLKDPTTWTAWSGMSAAALDRPAPHGDPLGVGSIRTQTRGRVIGFDEIVEFVPGKRFSYRHLRPLPVRDYRADVDLTPVDGGTDISWRATFRPKYPGTGWFWRLALQRMLQQLASALAEYAPRHPA
jgi:hypothetical protein